MAKDLSVMLKELKMFLLGEATEQESGERVFFLEDSEGNENVYTYTQISEMYEAKIRAKYDF